jgi:glycosyltransferase involved in cell wall biosynthesis
MSFAIRAIGPFRGPSGYDRITREYARGLVNLGVQLQLTPVDHWSPELRRTHSQDWFEAQTAELDPDVVVHFMMPDRCQPLRGKPNANYTMFEATGIPPQWRDLAGDFDLVIVPTAASRSAWIASGVSASRLRVCPLGVDAAFYARPVLPLALHDAYGRPVSRYRRRFLHVGEVRPRKNHLGLLRTWLTATRPDDDAILILKCLIPPYLARVFQDDLEEMQVRAGRRLDEAAPVLFFNDVLTDERMRALYRAATHYVSMSHGEGWDLPMMEAAASGLSLIAPDHSSYRSYLGDADADWIPAHEVEVRFEGQLGREDLAYFRGLSWWQPDEAEAAAVFTRLIRGAEPLQPPPTERMLREYGWDHAARRLLAVLRELA